jgi:hypothetical protein
MEADWEIEIGGGAPVIEAAWPGFVDLRRNPELAAQLPETVQLPALAETLAKLNAEASPVWTSKCDVWPVVALADPVVDPAESAINFVGFDPDELDAPPGCAAHALACYIDLLPSSDQQWVTPIMAADECKIVCNRLSAVPLRSCRLDLIIRQAFIATSLANSLQMDLGITAYLTSCGSSEAEASSVLQSALQAFAAAFCGHSKLE